MSQTTTAKTDARRDEAPARVVDVRPQVEHRREHGEEADEQDRPLRDPPEPAHHAFDVERVADPARHHRAEDEQPEDEQEGDPHRDHHLHGDEPLPDEAAASPPGRRRG